MKYADIPGKSIATDEVEVLEYIGKGAARNQHLWDCAKVDRQGNQVDRAVLKAWDITPDNMEVVERDGRFFLDQNVFMISNNQEWIVYKDRSRAVREFSASDEKTGFGVAKK